MSPTYEDVAESIVGFLARKSDFRGAPPSWHEFSRLSDLVHGRYEVPSTTITPSMRRLLFALGKAQSPQHPLGVGTYYGYAFSWIVGSHRAASSQSRLVHGIGIDVDEEATSAARRNSAVLGHATRLEFLRQDARWYTPPHEVDLLFLDLDDPCNGKDDYVTVLRRVEPSLKARALVLAHDPCVPKFRRAFERLHQYVADTCLYSGPWVFPVDPCGLSVMIKQSAVGYSQVEGNPTSL